MSARPRYDWTAVDPILAALRPPIPVATWAALGAAHGMPAYSVRNRFATKFRARCPGLLAGNWSEARNWTPAADDALVADLQTLPLPVVAARSGRTVTAICRRILLLDLGPELDAP